MGDSKPQGDISPEDLRSCSIAVYCGAVERDAADEIARRFRRAADTIEALRRRIGELEALTTSAYRDGERAIERAGKLEHDLRYLQESTVDRKAWEQARERLAKLKTALQKIATGDLALEADAPAHEVCDEMVDIANDALREEPGET